MTKDLGTQELWYGNPASFQGYVCKCGNKCDASLLCASCLNKVYGGVNNYICLMTA